MVNSRPVPPRTTVDLLRDVAATHGEREAYVDAGAGVRLTFAEWDRAADGVAAHLHDRGVRKGDVVALFLPSSADYAIAYQAAMRLGAVTTGVNLRLGPAEVGHILRLAEPKVVLTEESRSELAEAATLDAPPLPRLDPTDDVAIVWTSGTTGVPKGAVFDHECFRATARSAGPLSARFDRRVNAIPFAHVAYMARQWDEIEHVITTVITPTPWKAGEALRVLEDERITVGQGVPAQWSLLLAHPDFDTTDLSSLRIAGTGAATSSPELVREMRERLGCPVIVRYASTETSSITGSVPGDRDEVVARTVGRPQPDTEVEVVDRETGEPLGTGEIGVVRCRSRANMRRYWRDPERTRDVLDADGWITTGDLGSFDADGNLTLHGRTGEMYIRGGYNVYPPEVEAALDEHPAVERSAVVGVPDPVLGEIGVAFVVGRDVKGDELRSWCRSRLADYKAPDRVVVVDELPLTSMLKVDKRALADRAARDDT
jgi:acyl-CoA synthetase (AMP-forming)/AMP-acid ligase II